MADATIKEIAGKILLYVYYRCRTNAVEFEHYDEIIFNFGSTYKKVKISGKGQLPRDLQKMGYSDNDLYEALKLLIKSRHIESLRGRAGIHLANIQLTPYGYDVIEGIERSSEDKKNFFTLFNIRISNNMNIDSLIKSEIGNIVGLGGAVSGKLGR